MGKAQNNLSVQIKDLIDTIYELVKGPAGYTGALTRLSSQASIVVPILKQRGILICTTPPKNNNPHYLWSEKAMAPNNTLYRNIINDYMGIKYAKNVKERERRSLARKADSCNSQPVQQNLQPVHAPEPKPEKPYVESIRYEGTGYWLLEYNETQSNGMFHLEEILQGEDGNRTTHHGVGTNKYVPVAIIPDRIENSKLFSSVLDFTERFMMKGLPVEDIANQFGKAFPKKLPWSPIEGLHIDFSTLSDIEFPEKKATKTNQALASFTEQELWDELKLRGAIVIDGKIKVIKEYELA